MRPSPVILAVLSSILASWATAKEPPVPKRQLPPEIVTGLRLLDYEFARALAQDCAPERCFAKGCVHVAHTVVDQPATGSMPGLRLEPGPGAPRQVYLTTAECSFAHEKSVSARDARALATRLKAKVSRAWTKVEVVYEKLQPLPDFIRESPEPPRPEPEPVEEIGVEDEAAGPASEPEQPTWETPVAMRELWLSLLPHFAWMIALIMLTFAVLMVIWALRRLGRESPEEQALMAQLLGSPGPDGGGGALPGEGSDVSPGLGGPQEDSDAAARVSKQHQSWRERLATGGAAEIDPALQALVTDLLRTGERRLLAKAVMLFPDELPKAFPTGGTLASAKFDLAEFLKNVDPASLPSDEVFFEKLNRYALAASLTAHPDTDLIRSLHDELGATALVDLLGAVPPRNGALLFALAPDAMQHEAVGLLTQRQLSEIVDQLMRSNRMDPMEAEHLLTVLAALRSGEPIPAPPEHRAVSDRGTEFSATAALSILLPRLDPEARAKLVNAAANRLNGSLPTWIEGTLYGDMLLELDDMTRNDLLLEVDVNQLSAWLRVQTPAAGERLLEGAPNALRVALSACPAAASQDAHYALVNDGRKALSAALQRRLLSGDIVFQTLLV